MLELAKLLRICVADESREPVPEVLSQIKDDPEIGILVLGAGIENKGPGPLITQLTKSAGSLPIPMTIVPGDLSKERLEALT